MFSLYGCAVRADLDYYIPAFAQSWLRFRWRETLKTSISMMMRGSIYNNAVSLRALLGCLNYWMCIFILPFILVSERRQYQDLLNLSQPYTFVPSLMFYYLFSYSLNHCLLTNLLDVFIIHSCVVSLIINFLFD